MFPLRLCPAMFLLASLAACSPTYNWRDVRVTPTSLQAQLPCKPDQGQRQVSIAGRQVDMHVLGCDAGRATFAIMFADIGEPAPAGAMLAQWKAATLANMRAASTQERMFLPPGALGVAESVQVAASGRRTDGSAVMSRAAYFTQGTGVFQAAIYADQLVPEQADTFFSALRFE